MDLRYEETGRGGRGTGRRFTGRWTGFDARDAAFSQAHCQVGRLASCPPIGKGLTGPAMPLWLVACECKQQSKPARQPLNWGNLWLPDAGLPDDSLSRWMCRSMNVVPNAQRACISCPWCVSMQLSASSFLCTGAAAALGGHCGTALLLSCYTYRTNRHASHAVCTQLDHGCGQSPYVHRRHNHHYPQAALRTEGRLSTRPQHKASARTDPARGSRVPPAHSQGSVRHTNQQNRCSPCALQALLPSHSGARSSRRILLTAKSGQLYVPRPLARSTSNRKGYRPNQQAAFATAASWRRRPQLPMSEAHHTQARYLSAIRSHQIHRKLTRRSRGPRWPRVAAAVICLQLRCPSPDPLLLKLQRLLHRCLLLLLGALVGLNREGVLLLLDDHAEGGNHLGLSEGRMPVQWSAPGHMQ